MTGRDRDDCISRQAALDALEWKWAGKAAFDAIKDLPSVNPQDPIEVEAAKLQEAYNKGHADGGANMIELIELGKDLEKKLDEVNEEAKNTTDLWEHAELTVIAETLEKVLAMVNNRFDSYMNNINKED